MNHLYYPRTRMFPIMFTFSVPPSIKVTLMALSPNAFSFSYFQRNSGGLL
jgi:hypothetical protein